MIYVIFSGIQLRRCTGQKNEFNLKRNSFSALACVSSRAFKIKLCFCFEKKIGFHFSVSIPFSNCMEYFKGNSFKSASLAEYLAIVETKSPVVPVPPLGVVETHPKLERQARAEWKTFGVLWPEMIFVTSINSTASVKLFPFG